MRLITSDDLIETYSKLRQKGVSFLLSKFNPNALKRTESSFNQWEHTGAYWWMIPAVRRRYNKLISGNEDEVFEDYFARKHLAGKSGLKMLSLGTGTCSHEMRFAKMPGLFAEIKCMDIASTVLEKAEQEATAQGISNMLFEVGNVNEVLLPDNYYDIVMFHSSLHHFRNIDDLLRNKVKHTLKKEGLLLVNEYVGASRLQFPSQQVQAMNEALKLIPVSHRRRFKTGIVKNSVSGPGLLRMLVADPSECVESALIVPTIHKYFQPVEEKPYGGNMLMVLLKDIAHHFIVDNDENLTILQKLFKAEDEYLNREKSDFLFGVYLKR